MSRPCRGSSKINRSGSFTKARANNINRCSPEDRVRKGLLYKVSIQKVCIQASAIFSCSGEHFRYSPIESKNPEPTICIAGTFSV